jgi:hypothetical protein
MDRHRALIGLAVGPADLDPIPLSVRWAYTTGTAPSQDTHAPKRGWRLSKGSPLTRAAGWQIAHTTVWRRRVA